MPPVLARDQLDNFDRLVEIAYKYPEIRSIILPSLQSNAVGPQTRKTLSQQFASTVEDDRVFAISAATDLELDDIQSWIEKGLRDDSQAVRIAATKGLSIWLDEYQSSLQVVPQLVENEGYGASSVHVFSDSFEATPSTGAGDFFSAIGDLFGDGSAGSAAEMEEAILAELESAGGLELDAEFGMGLDSDDEGDVEIETEDEVKTEVLSEATVEAYNEMMAESLGSEAPESAADKAEAIQAAKKYDEWLAGWLQAPESEVKWLKGVPEIVDKLTKLDDPEARSHAMLVSVRLGADVSIDDIRKAMRHVDEVDQRITALYPWMLPESRKQFFDLLDDAGDADDLLSKLYDLASRYDPAEAVDLYWNALKGVSHRHVGICLEHTPNFDEDYDRSRILLLAAGQGSRADGGSPRSSHCRHA